MTLYFVHTYGKKARMASETPTPQYQLQASAATAEGREMRPRAALLGEPRPARSHRTDRPLGCRRGTRSVLLPPTPFLIFSFHGFAIKSNYSLVIFMGSQGTPNECIKDRATQKTIANSKPQHFQLRSRAATGEPMWSLDVWGTKALHKVFLPDLNRSPDC